MNRRCSTFRYFDRCEGVQFRVFSVVGARGLEYESGAISYCVGWLAYSLHWVSVLGYAWIVEFGFGYLYVLMYIAMRNMVLGEGVCLK